MLKFPQVSSVSSHNLQDLVAMSVKHRILIVEKGTSCTSNAWESPYNKALSLTSLYPLGVFQDDLNDTACLSPNSYILDRHGIS